MARGEELTFNLEVHAGLGLLDLVLEGARVNPPIARQQFVPIRSGFAGELENTLYVDGPVMGLAVFGLHLIHIHAGSELLRVFQPLNHRFRFTFRAAGHGEIGIADALSFQRF